MAYRQRIRFMQDTQPDSDVDPVYGVFMADVPADVVPVGGGERYRGRQIEANTKTIIECRYYPGFKTNMIAVNQETGAQYLINRMIEHQGRLRTLIFECNDAGQQYVDPITEPPVEPGIGSMIIESTFEVG